MTAASDPLFRRLDRLVNGAFATREVRNPDARRFGSSPGKGLDRSSGRAVPTRCRAAPTDRTEPATGTSSAAATGDVPKVPNSPHRGNTAASRPVALVRALRGPGPSRELSAQHFSR